MKLRMRTREATRRVSMKIRACLIAFVIAGFCAAPFSAMARPPSSLDYTPALDHGLLGEGRQAYRERADHARARDAYEAFSAHYRENPEDPVAGWHLALSCYYMGKRVVESKAERKRLYAEGRKRAEAALARDSDCGPCHLLAAINYALWGREVGIFRTLVGLPTVKAHLNRAAELDPAFGGGAPYRIQAIIAQALPTMFGGGKKRARKAVEKAIEAAPEEPLNYELLAYMLLEKYGDKKRALEVARRGLEVPDPGPDYVESLDALEELQKLVDTHDPTGGQGAGKRASVPDGVDRGVSSSGSTQAEAAVLKEATAPAKGSLSAEDSPVNTSR